MTRARYAAAGASDKSSEAGVFGLSRTDVRSPIDMRLIFQHLFPTKTAAELACRTGMSVRAAEHWLAGRSGLSGQALAALLRSDVGLEVLEGIIGGGKPLWWRDFRRKIEIGKLIREQDEIERRLNELKRE